MLNSVSFNKKPEYRTSFPVTFEGLGENLRLGEKVLREFKKETPNVKSFTYVQAKFDQNADKTGFRPLFHDFLKKINTYYRGYERNVKALADFYPKTKSLQNSKTFVEKLKSLLLDNQFINCYEISEMIKLKLRNAKQKPKLITMEIRKKDSDKIIKHTFPVFGLKNRALASKQKTWGNEAVVVDGWANIAMPVKNAMEFFESLFQFDFKKDNVVFKQVSYQKNGYEHLKNL